MNLVEMIQMEVGTDDSVLDLGCGIMNHTNHLNCGPIVGVDAHIPYLKQIAHGVSTVLCRLQDISNTFINNSYDIVLCLDVIEHLEKAEAESALSDMEAIAGKRVVIFTTDGFVEQNDGHGWGKNNEKWQKHRCGFNTKELESFGYRVSRTDCGGLFGVKKI